MKKRFGILLLCLLLIESCMNMPQVSAAAVDNNMTSCAVNQYYFFDCTETDCQVLFKEISGGGGIVPVESTEVVSVIDVPDLPQETVAIDSEIEILNNPGSSPGQDDNGEQPLTPPPVLSVVQADNGEYPYQSIRINEVVSAAETGEKEWVELHNATSQSIDLQSWIIEEGAGTKVILSGQIESNGYLVFETKNLNNSGDLILLKDPSGKVIDHVVYGDWEDGSPVDNFLASGKGESLSLYEDTYVVNSQITKGRENIYEPSEQMVQDSTETTSQIEIVVNPPPIVTVVPEIVETAGAATVPPPESTPPAYQFSTDISINEFLPAPATGAEEWIELYNSGTVDVDLRGWSIDDAVGGSAPSVFSESRIIKAKGYLVLPQSKTKLQLNNTGDEVRLLDPNKKVIEAVPYTSSRSNVSWSKIDTEWIETEVLTPEFVNAFQVGETIDEPLSISGTETKQSSNSIFTNGRISEVAALNLKTQVMVEAAVTVLPGAFSKNIIYIQDETGGIQVYFDAATWPPLEIGREVTIAGTISQSLGEKRILIKNAADIFVKETTLAVLPLKVDNSMLNSALVGSLVELEATLFEKDGSTWFVTDPAGGLKVFLKKGAKISSTLFNVNDKLKITGVLVQTNGEFVIQPRSEQDIVNLTLLDSAVAGTSMGIQSSINPGPSGRNVFLGLGVFAALLAAVILVFLSKRYLSKRQIRGLWYRFKTSFQI